MSVESSLTAADIKQFKDKFVEYGEQLPPMADPANNGQFIRIVTGKITLGYFNPRLTKSNKNCWCYVSVGKFDMSISKLSWTYISIKALKIVWSLHNIVDKEISLHQNCS